MCRDLTLFHPELAKCHDVIVARSEDGLKKLQSYEERRVNRAVFALKGIDLILQNLAKFSEVPVESIHTHVRELNAQVIHPLKGIRQLLPRTLEEVLAQVDQSGPSLHARKFFQGNPAPNPRSCLQVRFESRTMLRQGPLDNQEKHLLVLRDGGSDFILGVSTPRAGVELTICPNGGFRGVLAQRHGQVVPCRVNELDEVSYLVHDDLHAGDRVPLWKHPGCTLHQFVDHLGTYRGLHGRRYGTVHALREPETLGQIGGGIHRAGESLAIASAEVFAQIRFLSHQAQSSVHGQQAVFL